VCIFWEGNLKVDLCFFRLVQGGTLRPKLMRGRCSNFRGVGDVVKKEDKGSSSNKGGGGGGGRVGNIDSRKC